MTTRDRNGRWQVIRLADGAVSVCCTHRFYTLASWCSQWRNRRQPRWQTTGPRYDIRQEIRR